jgi:probable phosphoglycerate mutase
VSARRRDCVGDETTHGRARRRHCAAALSTLSLRQPMERPPLSDPQNPPLQVFVVRHGETEWSLSGQHTGVSEIPLTPHGEDEARALAPMFRDLPFTRVLTSPRQRARRTCELAGLGAAAETEPDLAEWVYGDYEGLTPAEIEARRPGWEVFRDGCPGGETPEQAAARADRLLQSLRGLRGNVALFTHGHFGRALGVRWIRLPIGVGGRFWLRTASVGILAYDPAHLDVPVIALWNEVPGGRA